MAKKFTIIQENDIVKIRLLKEEALTSTELTDALKQLGEEINNVVFFMDKIKYISSSGLSSLIYAKYKIKDVNEINVYLIGVKHKIANIIERCGVSDFFIIQDEFNKLSNN